MKVFKKGARRTARGAHGRSGAVGFSRNADKIGEFYFPLERQSDMRFKL